ncbi:MAG: TrmB family transcriptional regulator [Cuniculiplasma sp.]
MQENLFEGLSKFGLTSYEIKIYESLLLKGPMTSTNIVKETSIPQPRVYDLFSSLEKKGFIESSFGKKKLYRAISISTIMEREKKWLDSYSFNLEHYVQNKKIYTNDYSPFLSLVEGEKQVTEKMISLITETEDELILSTSYERFKILYPFIEKLSLKKATLCIIVFLSPRQTVEEKIEGNCFIRTMMGNPIELLISDRKNCTMKVESKERKNEVALYFEEDNFIHVISYYFNQSLWKYASIYLDQISDECIRFRTIWLACDIIEYFLDQGYRIKSHLEGFYKDDFRKMDGEIVRVEKIPFVKNTFFLKTRNEEFSVGGKTSSIEKIRMLFLQLKPEILQK